MIRTLARIWCLSLTHGLTSTTELMTCLRKDMSLRRICKVRRRLPQTQCSENSKTFGVQKLFFLTAVITYEVVVYTGDRWAASTDANVYVTIFGSHGDSGKRYLQHSRNNDAKFKRKQVFIVFLASKLSSC